MRRRVVLPLVLGVLLAASWPAAADTAVGAFANVSAGQYVYLTNLDPDTGCTGYTIEARQGPRHAVLAEVRNGSPWHGGVSESRWVSIHEGLGSYSGQGSGRICSTKLVYQGDPASGTDIILLMDPALRSGTLDFSSGGHAVHLTLTAQYLVPASYSNPQRTIITPGTDCPFVGIGAGGNAAGLYMYVTAIGTAKSETFTSTYGRAEQGAVGPYPTWIAAGASSC